jgi:1-acyl-sn-glycerol-3-phosphate acyltransferase
VTTNEITQTLAKADRTIAGAVLWLFLNVIQFVFTLAWSALWVTTALITLCLTFNRERAIAFSRRIWAPGLLMGAMARMVVEGFEDLPDTPHIYVFNHESLLDTPVVFYAVPYNLRFVAKKEVAYLPFIGWFCWAMGYVLVDRRNHSKAMASMAQAAKTVREGANVIFFSEGTRSRDGVIHPFKKGAFVLAIESGVPVVPCAISGSRQVLGCDGFRVRPATVRVKAGKPVPTAHLTLDDRDALIAEVRDTIIDLHESIGGAGGDKTLQQPAPARRAA